MIKRFGGGGGGKEKGHHPFVWFIKIFISII
jgi:hypothetical protein